MEAITKVNRREIKLSEYNLFHPYYSEKHPWINNHSLAAQIFVVNELRTHSRNSEKPDIALLRSECNYIDRADKYLNCKN